MQWAIDITDNESKTSEGANPDLYICESLIWVAFGNTAQRISFLLKYLKFNAIYHIIRNAQSLGYIERAYSIQHFDTLNELNVR